MRIEYFFTYPFTIAQGGGTVITKKLLEYLKKNHEVKPFDWETDTINCDVLLAFGCTYMNPEILHFYKEKGVKVVLLPIFDRMKPVWQMKMFKWLLKFPVLNAYSLRSQIFSGADIIIPHNKSELRDLVEIYDADASKMRLHHYGISDEIFTLDETVDKSLFFDKYGWTGFVFCSASTVTHRKNQLNLIKALAGTGVKLVINGTHNIEPAVAQEFKDLTENNPDILLLGRLDWDMLVSCYKNAKVCVSVSRAETAGLVNLEAGYLGANLVVSELEAYHEYLENWPTFIDQDNLEQIKSAVLSALKKPYDPAIREFIKTKYSWAGYLKQLETEIAEIVKS